MTTELSTEQGARDLAMHVCSVSVVLLGVCLAATRILRLGAAQTRAQTIDGKLFALDSAAAMFIDALERASAQPAA